MQFYMNLVGGGEGVGGKNDPHYTKYIDGKRCACQQTDRGEKNMKYVAVSSPSTAFNFL